MNVFLIEVSYLVLLRLNDDGFSPLDIAVMLGRPSIIKMLLFYGAQEGTKCMCFAHVSILNFSFVLMSACNMVFMHYQSRFPYINNNANSFYYKLGNIS